MVKDVRPVYPAIAIAAGVQGVVRIEARIGPNGRVVDARPVQSIPLLDNAALDAVRQWEFVPIAGDATFNATVAFVLSTAPLSNHTLPADAVGWPPSDFALYYRFECQDGVRQLGAGAYEQIADASGPPFFRSFHTISAGAPETLSLLLVQEGFFSIPDAATERSQGRYTRVLERDIEITVRAQRHHSDVTNTDGPKVTPLFHHELMVRTFGVWRIVKWNEPVAAGDERSAEASRVGVAVRRVFGSLAEKHDPLATECR